MDSFQLSLAILSIFRQESLQHFSNIYLLISAVSAISDISSSSTSRTRIPFIYSLFPKIKIYHITNPIKSIILSLMFSPFFASILTWTLARTTSHQVPVSIYPWNNPRMNRTAINKFSAYWYSTYHTANQRILISYTLYDSKRHHQSTTSRTTFLV